jgi:hypothetical protein
MNKVCSFVCSVVVVLLMMPLFALAAGDGLPVFDYKGVVKYYDTSSRKVASWTYQGYLIINTNGTSSSVWYWGTTTATKKYSVTEDTSMDFEVIDSNGAVFFSLGSSDMGFGKQTLNKKDGSFSSVSISGNIVDWSSYETGTFAVKYDSALTKKAIALGTNALDAVVANLIAKKYVLYDE